MLLPRAEFHTPHASVVESSYLCLFTITSDVEIFEADEELLTDRHEGTLVGAVDTDDDASGLVLYGNLLVDVAAEVVACYDTTQPQVVGNLLVAAVGNDGGVLALQLSDGSRSACYKCVVAVRRLSGKAFGGFPVLVLTRSHG